MMNASEYRDMGWCLLSLDDAKLYGVTLYSRMA